MAQNETWLKHDLLEAVKVQYLDGNLFSMDNAGNLIGVTLTRDGEDYSGGGSVSANVIRSDGGTVAVSGALSGKTATVVLPQAAYAVPGVVSIIVKLTASGQVTTIAALVANVYRSSTDTAVDPGTIIPSIQTLISQINTAVASIPADYSALWTKLAPAFSTDASYVAGQYVTYNSGLYRFNTSHSGSWSSSDVTAVNLGGEITELKSALITVASENLMGSGYNCNYPFEVKEGDKVTVSTSDGSIFQNGLQLQLLDENLTQLAYYTMYNNVKARTITFDASCNGTKYARWNSIPVVPLMVNKGAVILPYVKYFPNVLDSIDVINDYYPHNIEEIVKNGYEIVPVSWELGAITGTGAPYANNYNIRTTTFLSGDYIDGFLLSDINYRYSVCVYNASNNAYIGWIQKDGTIGNTPAQLRGSVDVANLRGKRFKVSMRPNEVFGTLDTGISSKFVFYKSVIWDMQKDINTVVSRNLVGSGYDCLYPVDLSEGDYLTVYYSDNRAFDGSIQMQLVGSDRETQVSYYTLQNGYTSRTIKLTATDATAKYIRWGGRLPTTIMVARGNLVIPYSPYFPALNDAIDNEIDFSDNALFEIGSAIRSTDDPIFEKGSITSGGTIYATDYYLRTIGAYDLTNYEAIICKNGYVAVGKVYSSTNATSATFIGNIDENGDISQTGKFRRIIKLTNAIAGKYVKIVVRRMDLTEKIQLTDIENIRFVEKLPSYLDVTKAFIESVRDLQTNNTVSFCWASDTHHQAGNPASPFITDNDFATMAKIAQRVRVDFLTITGDIVNGYFNLTNQKNDLVDVVKDIKDNTDVPAMMVEGNHDDNSWYASAQGSGGTTPTGLESVLTNDQFTNYVMTNTMEDFVFNPIDPLGGYYYKDFRKSKTRVIVLNMIDIPYIEVDGTLKYYGQWKFAIRQNQMNWIANTALKFTETGWGVIFLIHYDPAMYENPENIVNFDKLQTVISAYQSKTSGTVTSDTEDFTLNVSYDFTGNASDEVTAWFSGHVHADNEEVINGIPHISIICMFGSSGGGFDVVTVNRETKTITMKRFKNEPLTEYNRTVIYGS